MSTRSERAARHPNNRLPACGNRDCSYGTQPHFVPPSLGDIGFFLCRVPDDIVNHSRQPQPIPPAEKP